MKHLLTSIIVAINGFCMAQGLGIQYIQNAPDTIEVYYCRLGILRSGGNTTYSLDGKKCSEAEYKKVSAKNDQKKKCNPCYMKQFTLNDKLYAEGLYYYTCPVNTGGEIEVHSDENRKEIELISSSCPDGEWLYYKNNGKLKKKEMYKMGILMN